MAILLHDLVDTRAIQSIHDGTVEIMTKVGSEIHNVEAIRLLRKAGASVSGSRVFIPVKLLEKCLDTTPPQVTIFDRNGNPSLALGENKVQYGPGSDLPYFIDEVTGEGRRAILQDVANVAKVCDSLDNIDFLMSMALPSDVNPSLTDVYSVATMICNSRKSFVTATVTPFSTEAIVDLAAAIRGSRNKLVEKPYYIIYTQPTSPLTHSFESIQSLLSCAENGIPVTYASGLIAGGTAPVTMAGCIAVANAETLTGMVIHQLKKPGAPFIFGLIPSTMDMRTGISVYGGIELPLMHFASAQLGKLYQLPVFSTGGCSDSNSFDVQVGVDATFSITAAALSGADLVHDAGYMGGGLVGSLESLVLVDEIISGVKRFLQGFKVDEETLAVDTIADVGPGGHFLQAEHTLKHFKSEAWIPRFFDRLPYQVWLEQNMPTATDRIQEKVNEILAAGTPAELPRDMQLNLNQIIEKFETKIA